MRSRGGLSQHGGGLHQRHTFTEPHQWQQIEGSNSKEKYHNFSVDDY